MTGFDIEAMLGLFTIGVAAEVPATLDWDEQQSVMKEIETFIQKQKKCDEIIELISEFIAFVKSGENKRAFSKMFMVDVAIGEYNLIGNKGHDPDWHGEGVA